MPANLQRAQEVFLLAVEATDEESRRAVLDREACDSPDLRRRVEELLAANDDSDFLRCPAANFSTTVPVLEDSATPYVNDRYRLMQLLGEGGMGEVWRAEQREPVRRTVAIKLVKLGMDSKAVLARFESERQALALMDHPNIARVIDGGTTEAGRPYFVMELVRGTNLTEYCDSRHLNIEQRLALFQQICQGVQHAHQKGIIHRDLKPSNVLVAEHDGQPLPKIIDFGLAKVLGDSQRLSEASLVTLIGATVGTPLYMAPEQVGVNLLDVDTRVDVYALGVILYELLTGTTPLERDRFRAAAWDEVRRLIREEEPPRPSTRLSSIADLPSVAAQRATDPTRLNRQIKGDLDQIVMKALEKDRNRRYETAQSLALDVQRYLSGEEVEATPPSRRYRLEKFVRRNRAAVIAAGLIVLALLGGLGGTTWGLIRAQRARDAEAHERQEADAARARESARADAEALAVKEAALHRDRAVEAEKKARAEAQVAIAIRQFLQNDILQSANPFLRTEADPDLKMRDVLRRASATIEGRFRDQPQVEIAIRSTLGNSLLGVGAPAEALPHFERALALCQAYDDADQRATLTAMRNLGIAYWRGGAAKRALAHGAATFDLHKEKLGPDDPATLTAQMILGVIHNQRGDPQQAVPILEDCRARWAHVDGEKRDLPLLTAIHLGWALLRTGQLREAITMLEDVRTKCAATLGAEHLTTITAMRTLASAYLAADRRAAAIELIAECARVHAEKLGAEHVETLVTKHQLAIAFMANGQMARALPLLEHCHKHRTAKLSSLHSQTSMVFRDLALAYVLDKQPTKAVELSQSYVKLLRAQKPIAAGELVGAQLALGRALTAAGRATEAAPILRQCLEWRSKQKTDSWMLARAQAALGLTLLELNDYGAAKPLLLDGFRGMRDQSHSAAPGLQRILLTETASDLFRLFEAIQQPDEATAWRKQVEELTAQAKSK